MVGINQGSEGTKYIKIVEHFNFELFLERSDLR
jgi:hypothetical protein